MLLAILIVLLVIYRLWTRPFTYWKDRGIPGPEPSMFYGNTKSYFSSSSSYCLETEAIYNKYKNRDLSVVGYYAARTPTLLVVDVETVKEIMIKNFPSFYDNEACEMMSLSSDPIMSRNPFFQKSADWKPNRKQLVPGFTTNRIKSYYPIMRDVCGKLNKYLDEGCAKSKEVDINDLTGRFATELVSDIIFGVSSNALSHKIDSMVLKMGELYISHFASITNFFVWTGILPKLKQFYKFTMMQKEERTFFKGLIAESLQHREDGSSRNDYLAFLKDLQQKHGLDADQTLAHAMVFYLNGYDTCGVGMAHTLQELAKNQFAQDKLRAEIYARMEDNEGEISFDQLYKMEYLDAAINESLRLNPPFSTLIRQCTKEFQLDNNGSMITIPKGTPIMIHIAAIHRDDRFYERPMEFDPERFYGQDMKKFYDRGILMTFGAGPRICLGMKFGLVQLKLCICEIIKNYRLTEIQRALPDTTASASHFFGYPSTPIKLNVERISK